MWRWIAGLLFQSQGKDMRVVRVVPIILFGGFGVQKGVFWCVRWNYAWCDKKSWQAAGIFSVLMYFLVVRDSKPH